jgi:hypothetical protein
MTLHRKLLITSFLREAPYDDVLHEACPDYVPESIRQKREHDEAMRVSCCCCCGCAGVMCGRVQQRCSDAAVAVNGCGWLAGMLFGALRCKPVNVLHETMCRRAFARSGGTRRQCG